MTEKFLVLDTETCGDVLNDDSFCYDIGFLVGDYDGNIYEKHSYTIADFFLDKEMMETAFYKDKIPQYWEDIKNGSRKLRRLSTVRHIIFDICKQYDIKKIYAYNVKFDYDVLLNSQRLSTSSKYRYFLPYGLQIMDILKLGRELAKDSNYKNFCVDNGYLTKTNRPQTKAEVVARYLFEDDFIESHTGLEDCEIEFKIFLELAKRFDIDCQLWK